MSFVDLVVLKNISKTNGLVNSSRLIAAADGEHPYSPSNKADKQSRQRQNESYVGEVAHRKLEQVSVTFGAVRVGMTLDLVFRGGYLLNGFHLKIARK